MRRYQQAIFVFLILLAALTCWLHRVRAEQLNDLAPRGYVNDFANVLTHDTRVQLSNLSVELDDRAHAQLVVVTVHSTSGVPIEQFADEMYERWAIGYRPENRGVLVLIETDDGKRRITVGTGLESVLPQRKLDEIGRQIAPLVQKRDYDRAVLYLAGEAARTVGAERHVALAAQPNVEVDSGSGSLRGLSAVGLGVVVVLLVLVMGVGGLYIAVSFARHGGLGQLGGPRTGGSSGGSFGGFGGGGSFSGFGGGATGS
jgi:uncharacterized protein